MSADERYVRAAWNHLSFHMGPTNVHEAPCNRPAYILVGDGENIAHCEQKDVWQAAADFTRKRLVEVAKLQEEITWLDRTASLVGISKASIRILVRLRSELKKTTNGLTDQSWKEIQ